MTKTDYEAVGIALPDCEFAAKLLYRRRDGFYLHELQLDRQGRRATLKMATTTAEPPAREDALYRLLHIEANFATMFLRDFVADREEQTYDGRRAAIREWLRLRRQHRVLKFLFPEDCP